MTWTNPLRDPRVRRALSLMIDRGAITERVMEGAAEPAVAISVPLTVEARAALNWDEAH